MPNTQPAQPTSIFCEVETGVGGGFVGAGGPGLASLEQEATRNTVDAIHGRNLVMLRPPRPGARSWERTRSGPRRGLSRETCEPCPALPGPSYPRSVSGTE